MKILVNQSIIDIKLYQDLLKLVGDPNVLKYFYSEEFLNENNILNEDTLYNKLEHVPLSNDYLISPLEKLMNFLGVASDKVDY
jgi:hypothetical protein